MKIQIIEQQQSSSRAAGWLPYGGCRTTLRRRNFFSKIFLIFALGLFIVAKLLEARRSNIFFRALTIRRIEAPADSILHLLLRDPGAADALPDVTGMAIWVTGR